VIQNSMIYGQRTGPRMCSVLIFKIRYKILCKIDNTINLSTICLFSLWLSSANSVMIGYQKSVETRNEKEDNP